MAYQVVFKRSVLKDVRSLPESVLLRIREVIADLSNNPRPKQARKLKGYLDVYRYRYSRYRIVYQIDSAEKRITIVRIAHRKDVYRYG